jgi:hypothetical protein
MKIIGIILLVVLVVFIVAQLFIIRSTNKTESHKFKLIKKIEGVEIRAYEPAIFSYVVMNSQSFKASSNNGFRALAGYIFGGNQKNQKIAMTTPVSMSMDDSITMKFKIPSDMKLDELPKPNNAQVRFKAEPAKMVAAIKFGGWSSDEKIKLHADKLKSILIQNGVAFDPNYSYLGYNPPFQLLLRKNEIVVDLIGFN